jgi:hypothetical protein
MAPAFGQDAWKRLPACRGRHLHLDAFEPCGRETRTLGLGATNGWFARSRPRPPANGVTITLTVGYS